MNAGIAAEFALTCLAAIAFFWLAIERYRTVDHHRVAMAASSRLLLVDVLLAVAGFEMVADTVVMVAGRGTPLADVVGVAAVLGRGALVAGAIVLLATFTERYNP